MKKRKLKYRIAEALGYYMFRKKKAKGPFLDPEHHVVSITNAFSINALLDVGAHRGETALALRDLGYSGWIFSFEPHPECYSIIESLSAKDPKWKIFNFALDNTSGEKEFLVSANSTLSSFHSHSQYGEDLFSEGISNKKNLKVLTKRLDQIIDELIQISQCDEFFLKMDTQGNDLRVLEGASGCKDKIYGLLSELSVIPIYKDVPTYMDSLNAYSKLGFCAAGFYPVGWHKNGQVPHEVDVVMIKKTAENHLNG